MNRLIRNHVAALEREIRRLDDLVDDLEFRVYREKGDGKVRLYRQIGELRRRQQHFRERLGILKPVSRSMVRAV